MRRVLLVCCTGLACTRLNPAFDEARVSGESGMDSIADTSDSSAEASEADGSSTDDGLDDLPSTSSCEFEPSEGLALAFSNPSYFGGNCPNGALVAIRVLSGNGGEATLSVCGDGCLQCSGEHLLSTFPLVVTDHLPKTDACLMLEASSPLGQDASHCYWGGLSIYDSLNYAPYVIATTHSVEPTAYGTAALGGAIPAPAMAGTCSCDEVGQADDCCDQAPSPPEFWYYPFANMDVYPGDETPLVVPNLNTAQLHFELFQAELLHSCEIQGLQLSWAVVAEL